MVTTAKRTRGALTLKTFYCRAKPGVWGYRKAATKELALSCFMQDMGLLETEAASAFATTVDTFKVSRLLDYIPSDMDPWKCKTPFTLDAVSRLNPEDISSEGTHVKSNDEWLNGTEDNRATDHKWHAARVMWMVKNPQLLEDPIEVDNHCDYSRVLPVPIIIDGWHRFFAHRFMGTEKIPVLYSGRVDLMKYLSGKGKKPPVE